MTIFRMRMSRDSRRYLVVRNQLKRPGAGMRVYFMYGSMRKKEPRKRHGIGEHTINVSMFYRRLKPENNTAQEVKKKGLSTF